MLLTTHLMDEADALSDRCGACASAKARPHKGSALSSFPMSHAVACSRRIGIFVAGSLRCLGTSLRLKSQFGDGLRLSVGLAAVLPPTPPAQPHPPLPPAAGPHDDRAATGDAPATPLALPARMAAVRKIVRLALSSPGGGAPQGVMEEEPLAAAEEGWRGGPAGAPSLPASAASRAAEDGLPHGRVGGASEEGEEGGKAEFGAVRGSSVAYCRFTVPAELEHRVADVLGALQVRCGVGGLFSGPPRRGAAVLACLPHDRIDCLVAAVDVWTQDVQDELGIKDVAVRLTSLEEVFLRVASA